MRSQLDHYDVQAKRLAEISNLLPVQILSDELDPNQSTQVYVWPPDNPHGDSRDGYVRGIRLFHGPREVVIENITFNRYPVLAGPFDAAAYACETPMAPLEFPIDENYRGEALRFCAVNWGVISRERPLSILAKPWGNPAQRSRLCGYLVCELVISPVN